MSAPDPFNDKSGLWTGFGCAVFVLALCLGVGSCTWMLASAAAIKADAAASRDVRP